MKKKPLIALSVIFLCLFFIGTLQAKVVIKVAHESSVEHNINKSLLFFAKKVAEKTNNEVEIKVFPNGQLGDERAIYEGVKIGTIDAGTGGLYESVDPKFSLINLPFLFKSYEQVHTVLDGPIGQDLKKRAYDNGYKVMAIFDSGFRQFTNNKKPIWAPEDFKGLVIRTPPIKAIIESMKAFGANVVSIPYGEVYMAMKQGVADGEENSLTNITGMKFYEVQKYISISNYIYSGDMFIMNKKLWDSLSASHQKSLDEAAGEALAFQRNLLKTEELDALDTIMAAGCKVNLVYAPPFYPLVQHMYDDIKEYVPASLVNEIRKMK